MRAILTWHSIDGSGSPISVSREDFTKQVGWLLTSGVQVASVAEILTMSGDQDAVALTFDDGFANFATEAAPILRGHGLPATLFVVTDHVGGDNRWCGTSAPGIPVLPLLGWDALARLCDEGVTIGAHSRSHPRFDRVVEAEELAEESEGCARILEQRLGVRPEGFAYPYGVLNEAVVKVVARSFGWACTTDLRVLGEAEDRHRLPRVDACYLRRPERLGRWGSPRLRGWVRLRQGGRQLKSLLGWAEGT